MAYATRQDMIARFGVHEVEQIESNIVRGQATNPDEQLLLDSQRHAATEAALADCSAEADSYIARRYSLPLVDQPTKLTHVVCDLARYALWKDQPSPEVRQRYEDAMSWLKAVSSGAAILVTGRDVASGSSYVAGSVFVV